MWKITLLKAIRSAAKNRLTISGALPENFLLSLPSPADKERWTSPFDLNRQRTEPKYTRIDLARKSNSDKSAGHKLVYPMLAAERPRTGTERCAASKPDLSDYSVAWIEEAAATRVAEAGSSAQEIMAVTDHKTLSDVDNIRTCVNIRNLAKRSNRKDQTMSYQGPHLEPEWDSRITIAVSIGARTVANSKRIHEVQLPAILKNRNT